MFEFRLVKASEIDHIVSLVMLINTNTELSLLKSRIAEMFTQNYECMGVYDNHKLIACAGLWFQTRHYSGKCVEPDHVVVLPEYRDKGIGKQLITHCIDYAFKKGYEVTELNCYVRNTQGQRFWEQIGYKKLGYHYLLKLDLPN